jgi:hypothetical protein
MASDVFPFATVSKYFPRRINVMSIDEVSKYTIAVVFRQQINCKQREDQKNNEREKKKEIPGKSG